MVHFGEFLKICSLRSNSVTRQATFKRTKIGGKRQNAKNSNATLLSNFQTMCPASSSSSRAATITPVKMNKKFFFGTITTLRCHYFCMYLLLYQRNFGSFSLYAPHFKVGISSGVHKSYFPVQQTKYSSSIA